MPDLLDCAYLASAAMCASASLKSKPRESAGLWLAVSVGLLGLGLLRAAQGAVWIDDYLRDGAYVFGWYSQRRPVQVTFVFAFAFCCLLLFRRLRRTSLRAPLTFGLSAFTLLTIFAAIRSSSLHWTDAVLEQPVGSATLSEATQVVLLAAISVAAFVELARSSVRAARMRN